MGNAGGGPGIRAESQDLFFIGLVVGPLYYFLNKQLTVGFIEISGASGAFAFKRSVIEGQSIDESSAYEVIEVIRSLIEKRPV